MDPFSIFGLLVIIAFLSIFSIIPILIILWCIRRVKGGYKKTFRAFKK